MKKTSIGLLTLILVAFLLWVPSCSVVIGGPAEFKVSGYVLDSNGNGIAGAKVTFVLGSPFYPTAYTNNSGYYEVVPYSGVNWMVTVTPPSDSNYLVYSQQSFDVQSNMTANFTLSLGYRLTGYVLDQNLNPIRAWSNGGVGIFLDDYWSGKWADSNGSYYVVASAGTHTIYARKMEQVTYSGIGWSADYEILNNTVFNLRGNVNANIIIDYPNSTSSPTIAPTKTSTPTSKPTPTKTATATPYSSQKPTSTPTVPEFPISTILILLIVMMMACLLVYLKKCRRFNTVSSKTFLNIRAFLRSQTQ